MGIFISDLVGKIIRAIKFSKSKSFDTYHLFSWRLLSVSAACQAASPDRNSDLISLGLMEIVCAILWRVPVSGWSCQWPLVSVTRRSRSDVVHLLPDWLMVSNDLTDVTLVSDDTERGLDWCDSGEWRWLLETWLMWLWLLRRLFRDLTDVTLVSEDGFWRLDWCDSG